MTQMLLSDTWIDERERPRLSRQCVDILMRLLEGEASNKELSGIALKYTGRLSDLRASGIPVSITRRNHETGEVWYRLDDPESAPAFARPNFQERSA